MFECFYTVYLFLSIYRKWTNDLNRRYDPAVAGNNKILYKREHLDLVQCIVIFFSDQLTHLIQVKFNSLQWVVLGQTPTGVELNEGALRLLHRAPHEARGLMVLDDETRCLLNNTTASI